MKGLRGLERQQLTFGELPKDGGLKGRQRNRPCACGSGTKAKLCCWRDDDPLTDEELAPWRETITARIERRLNPGTIPRRGGSEAEAQATPA